MKMFPVQKLIASLSAVTIAISLSVIAFAADIPNNPVKGSEFSVTTADEWTNLFFRTSQASKTWLGADGIYSCDTSGYDGFASAKSNTSTFFIFSDTLMGTNDAQGKLIENAGMPSTTSAYLKGKTPSSNNLSFVYGNGGSMATGGQNLFGEKLWMLDIIALDDNIYCFGFKPSNDWKPENIKLAVIPVKNDGYPDYSHYCDPVDVSSKLWYRDSNYLYAYGVGIFNNTAVAGAPDPDGYIYLYGYRDALKEYSRKDMIISRIKAVDFPRFTYDPDNRHNYHPDFSKLEYYNGSGWSSNITDSAPVIKAVSCEFSVSPITTGAFKGKYIAVYTHNTEGNEVCYSIGDSPVGPFKTPHVFYTAPEHGQIGTAGYGTRYTYNAKAHPHLSNGTKLLVSYNCNVRNVTMNDQTAADYHPRFLWLDLGSDDVHESEGSVNSETSSAAVSSAVSSMPVSSEKSSEPISSTPISSETDNNPISVVVSSEMVMSDPVSSTVIISDEASNDSVLDSSDSTPVYSISDNGDIDLEWNIVLIAVLIAIVVILLIALVYLLKKKN